MYTLSTDQDSHKWNFTTVAVEEKDGVYSYELPDGVTAYAFEVYHTANGYKMSTPIYLND